MYDELVKRLRERAQRENDYYEHGGDVIIEAADAIEELQKVVEKEQAFAKCWEEMATDCKDRFQKLLDAYPKWIPVEEWLPEDLTRVIVFCEDGVSYGLCEHLIADDEEVVEWHDFLHYPITPTHWMPLPEPPKEE